MAKDKEEDYRKRLKRSYGTDKEWDALIELASKKGVSDLLLKIQGGQVSDKSEDEKEWKYSEKGASFKGKTEKSITTLEEALDFCQADLTKYKVKGWSFKSWDVTMKLKRLVGNDEKGKPVFKDCDQKRTNYGVSVDFLPIIDPHAQAEKEAFDKLASILSASTKQIKIKSSKGTGKGVAAIADIHAGASVKAVLNTKDFNLDVIAEKLLACAAKINEQKLEEVTLVLLGDFVESITGLNHMNTWQELEVFGSNAIIACYQLIKKCLIEKINNLKAIKIVSGNHDRLTSNRDLDPKGQVAGLLSFMFSENIALPVEHHPVLISFDFDGIRYLCTHGHYKLSNRDIRGLIFEHGKQDIFNVLLEGHKHTREVRKTLKKSKVSFEDIQMTKLDTFNVRSIVCPPIFTGNFWSASAGWTSTSGLTIVKNNGFGQINHLDFCI